MAQKYKILVAGATGYLGRYVVEEFKRRGYRKNQPKNRLNILWGKVRNELFYRF